MFAVAWCLLAPGCRALRAREHPDGYVRNQTAAEPGTDQDQSEHQHEPNQAEATGQDTTPTCFHGQFRRVVLVMANGHFMDMLRNWYYYATPYLSDMDLVVVVAEDREAEHQLEQDGTWTMVDTNGSLHLSKRRLIMAALRPPNLDYGSAAFSELVDQRPLQIKNVLKMGCTVLYTDIDTVWKRDPFKAIEALGRYDLYVPDDDCGNLATAKWYFCTGFLYLQPTPGVVRLLEDWDRRLEPGGTNQQPFNGALRASVGVSWKILPFEQFPPGCKADDHFPTAVVLHANWRRGKQKKIEFLRERGYWHER